MSSKKHEDESISIFPGEPIERHLEKHHGDDTKSRIKNIILEMEEHGLTFSLEEIIKHAVKKHIPRPEASAVLDELIKENYLRYIPGTDKLYMRSVWRDFSPAFEELPEF